MTKKSKLANEIRIEGDVAYIVLNGWKNGGKEVIVDSEDIQKLHRQFSSISIQSNKDILVMGANSDTKKLENVRRYLAEAEAGVNVFIKNGNPLDLRKSNLTFANTRVSRNSLPFVNTPVRIDIRPSSERRESLELALPYEALDTFMLRDYFGGCAISTERVEFYESHYDHFMPISWGHGGHTKGNMYPLQDTLNFRKSNKNPFDFFAGIADELSPAKMQNFKNLVGFLAYQNGMNVDEFVEYVDWCEANQRSAKQVEADNERYGRKISSVELFRIAKAGRIECA